MSERKSAEIKFRCTPSFKAETQVDAAAVGESLTVYVERAVQERKFRAGMVEARAALAAGPEAVVEYLTGDDLVVGAIECWDDDRSPEDEDSAATGFVSDDTPAGDDEPPVDAEGRAVACECRPWEFCTHKVDS